MLRKGLLYFTLLTLFSLGSLSPVRGSGGFVIIVNKQNPVETMTSDTASALFLKKITRWDNGRRVLPLDQSAKSATRQRFSKDVLGRSVSAVKNYWQQEIFAGREVPPPEKSSDSEVVAYVAANPDAIGYVSAAAAINGNVRVVKITD